MGFIKTVGIMRRIYTSVWLIAIFTILALTSCDPVSSVEFKIYNKTSDTVTVDMYKEILSSSYGGYSIVESDSVTTHYGEEDSVSVAVLAPDQILWTHKEWHGLYREEQIANLWQYIKSIKVGDKELPSESWKKEPAWHLRTEGGKRFEGESRYYTLTLRNK